MAGIVSEKTYDENRFTPVSVIASFDTKGDVQLLYVRLKHEPLKVLETVLLDSGMILSKILRFRVTVQDSEYKKELEIRYHKTENIWVVPKEYVDRVGE